MIKNNPVSVAYNSPNIIHRDLGAEIIDITKKLSHESTKEIRVTEKERGKELIREIYTSEFP
jgi:hypothetical protein